MRMPGIIKKFLARSERDAPEPEAPCDTQLSEPVEWLDTKGWEDDGEADDGWPPESHAGM